MKADQVFQEIESVKDRLAGQAQGDVRQFLDQMDGWLKAHPHAGPVVKSPTDLQARLRQREVTEPPSIPLEPYKVYDPIIAEVHRTREKLYREQKDAPLILKDDIARNETRDKKT
jgi:hypothetical protein